MVDTSWKKELCIRCRVKPVFVKRSKLCQYCYGHTRHQEYKRKTGYSIRYSSEIEFVKNFFNHKNWVYHPVIFHLNGVNYEPDFYDGKRNIFIEVSGTRQAFQSNFDKYKLFIETYPRINFEVRDIKGRIKPLEKRSYVKKQDSVKNKS